MPDYAPEPPIGSIVTDNGHGWPWVRSAGGEWTRDAGRTFLTWAGVYAWCQRAVDDPDDDTTEPFYPVVMVPDGARKEALREAEGVVIGAASVYAIRALAEGSDAMSRAYRLEALEDVRRGNPYRGDAP